jgi:hypothetical protein
MEMILSSGKDEIMQAEANDVTTTIVASPTVTLACKFLLGPSFVIGPSLDSNSDIFPLDLYSATITETAAPNRPH